MNIEITKDNYEAVKKDILSPYMQDFVEALLNVEPRYIMYPIKGKEERVKQIERIFAYEFYHQYRLIMQTKPDLYSGIYLNGEISKADSIYDNVLKCYPDLVLHGDPGKIENGKQYFLCEMKTMDNSNDYKADLKKLTELSCSPLKFQNYIFLAIGDDLQNLKEKIEDFTPYCCNILCICISLDGKKVGCAHLSELR
mgnify:CR=1 FL=1